MHHARGPLILALALCLALGAPSHASDRPFDYVTIEVPNSVGTWAYGINAAGHIVGFYIGNDGTEGAFLLRNGEYTTFTHPGADWTEARGITPRGDIVGMYGKEGRIRGYLRTVDGQFFPIDFPGATNTMPIKMSPTGKIVGCFHNENSTTTMFGFELDAAGYSSFSLHSTMHNGVSPDGNTIVGFRLGQSYILQNGTFTTFTVPDSLATFAWDVNAAGEITGVYRLAGLPAIQSFRGFLRSPAGDFTTIHVPGAIQTRAFAINSGGDVVGMYLADGVIRGFMLSRSRRLTAPGQ